MCLGSFKNKTIATFKGLNCQVRTQVKACLGHSDRHDNDQFGFCVRRTY